MTGVRIVPLERYRKCAGRDTSQPAKFIEEAVRTERTSHNDEEEVREKWLRAAGGGMRFGCPLIKINGFSEIRRSFSI